MGSSLARSRFYPDLTTNIEIWIYLIKAFFVDKHSLIMYNILRKLIPFGGGILYRILIADDEPDVVCLLRDYFLLGDYTVITAKSGKEAIERSSERPDIILLDINMPDIDGLEVCRRIRSSVSCPILFLTAKIEESDKVAGFAAGGDDYIIKPFSLKELEARVAAHIRRDHRDTVRHDIKIFGSLIIDNTLMSVSAGGVPVELAKKEYQILELLSSQPGMIFDKERLYEKIWGYDAEGDSSVVAEHVRRLRVKLRKFNEDQHIETVWGMGYRWKR